MKNREMYKFLLPKGIIIELSFFLLVISLIVYLESKSFSFLITSFIVYGCIMIIIVLGYSFYFSFKLMKYINNSKDLKKARFYLQILPYEPPVFGTFLVVMGNTWGGNIFTIAQIIYVLAGTLLFSFIASIILNSKIGISKLFDFKKNDKQ